MVKWEYRVFHFPMGPDVVQEKLNEAGKDGWELVAVGLNASVFFLKRPLPSTH